jgi:hypothetical protein
MLKLHPIFSALLIGLLSTSPVWAQRQRSATPAEPAGRAQTTQAEQMPQLRPLPALPGKPIFSALYQCTDASGAGCTASCGTASFSPIVYLAVSLRAVPASADPKSHDLYYYYMAQFAETATKTGTKAVPDAKRKEIVASATTPKEVIAVKPDLKLVNFDTSSKAVSVKETFGPTAAGFTLDARSLCGTVNMQATFCTWQSLAEQPTNLSKLCQSAISLDTRRELQRARVLWVDGHRENNRIELQMLQRLGASITISLDRNDASDQLDERDFDLVICDEKPDDETNCAPTKLPKVGKLVVYSRARPRKDIKDCKVTNDEQCFVANDPGELLDTTLKVFSRLTATEEGVHD